MDRVISSVEEAREILERLPVRSRLNLAKKGFYITRLNKHKFAFVTPYKEKKMSLKQATNFIVWKIVI